MVILEINPEWVRMLQELQRDVYDHEGHKEITMDEIVGAVASGVLTVGPESEPIKPDEHSTKGVRGFPGEDDPNIPKTVTDMYNRANPQPPYPRETDK